MTYHIKKTYQNGAIREMMVIAVQETDDPDTVVLQTEESGEVLLCRRDDPAMWSQLAGLGLVSE